MTRPGESGGYPKLAVIVPHYNDLARLSACLDALAPELAAAGPRVEAVVVDNASPVDLGPLAARHPRIRFVTETRKGAAAARNRGVHETVAPLLAFLDCDCVPAPDWLAVAMRLAGSADVIGGRIDTFDETPGPRSGAEAFETVFAFHQKDYIERKGFSVTANLLTSRAVFEDVGELIVGLSEDVEWCRRAAAKGHALVYADDLRVSHPTRADWPSLARKWRRTTAEGFHLNGTTPAARAKWALRAVAVAGSGLVHLPRLLGAPQLASRTERARGAATLLRLRLARAGWMLRQAASGE
ncbi:MAG: glycosyltransferase [Rhodobacteraceae bacterium]|nr:glycosyltransferase [Paracoccaceae bacterium]